MDRMPVFSMLETLAERRGKGSRHSLSDSKLLSMHRAERSQPPSNSANEEWTGSGQHLPCIFPAVRAFVPTGAVNVVDLEFGLEHDHTAVLLKSDKVLKTIRTQDEGRFINDSCQCSYKGLKFYQGFRVAKMLLGSASSRSIPKSLDTSSRRILLNI